MSKPLRGLYAITSEALCASPEKLMQGVNAALRGGAVLIQYRDKWSEPAQRERNAIHVQALCRDAGAAFILNDGPAELTARQRFDGLHLGQKDGALETARALLPQALIGVTCSNSLERALAAEAGGASYVAFGRFFASRTKPDAPGADISLLHAAREKLKIPVCAIGGITPDNAPALIEAGADLIAAVEGVFGAADIEAAARSYAGLFN